MSNDSNFTNEQLKNFNKKIKFECPRMEATCDYVEDLIEAVWNLANEIQPLIDKFSLDANFHIDQFQIDRIQVIQVLINKLRGATPI